MSDNTRPLEEGVVKDFRVEMSYGQYLHLDELLTAQHLVSRPPHHDELLFIIQHQTSELWLKLARHELAGACDDLAGDDVALAQKRLARVKQVQKQLIEQWSVLATLTPSEYQEFRGFLGSSSGFQSYQYRAVEFLLGAKDPAMLEVFADDAAARSVLTAALDRRSLYDEFLRLLARRGHAVPADVLERDVREPHREDPRLVEVFRAIYDAPERSWDVY
jgi:tryptophan 2,3-dioxygenase